MSARKRFGRHVSLYLDDAQFEALRAEAKRSGLDASKILRRALAEYLNPTPKTTAKPKRPTTDKRGRALPTGETLPIVLVWGD